ncbi:hypothetical protein CLAFUW4_14796 [Fulvia fulva]|uniref:Uncharacterized protein n=1 Tax=Passalora fulva TaxID=5499 RepID=A0A9Q8PMG3_PASFU|nr:uncharacterized protein CLAFUR5_14621 [Fulvia fulva]KAK4608821.1 hypothetical protein CLAFUR4_14804 [Fulvia fulva]KAK4609807.1 hypothetical protein CLAFUR0_14788 [Fulvia fulva]UJO25236.1 hypothetical protein CLAFUR5_14621 [Fulvia fulva]WPV22925.1 hypothetical protein CLAFUW4_14796 [Fulvia fulva]WPV37820.1 hypothetical protein CLAFUW7_14797 [Fulvia fulva]
MLALAVLAGFTLFGSAAPVSNTLSVDFNTTSLGQPASPFIMVNNYTIIWPDHACTAADFDSVKLALDAAKDFTDAAKDP